MRAEHTHREITERRIFARVGSCGRKKEESKNERKNPFVVESECQGGAPASSCQRGATPASFTSPKIQIKFRFSDMMQIQCINSRLQKVYVKCIIHEEVSHLCHLL